MDWEPQLAPPVHRPVIEEYARQFPWGTGVVAAILLAIFFATSQVTPSTCAEMVYPGTCFARGLMETSPTLAVFSFPLLHGNSTHLLSNLIPLLILGVLLEQKRSSLAFIGIVAMAGYLSVYADIAMGVAMGEPAIAIGASGATRALGGLILVQYATVNPVSLVNVEPGQRRWTALVVDIGRMMGILLAISLLLSSILEYVGAIEALPEIALFAHLVGAATGVFAGLLFKLG